MEQVQRMPSARWRCISNKEWAAVTVSASPFTVEGLPYSLFPLTPLSVLIANQPVLLYLNICSSNNLTAMIHQARLGRSIGCQEEPEQKETYQLRDPAFSPLTICLINLNLPASFFYFNL